MGWDGWDGWHGVRWVGWVGWGGMGPTDQADPTCLLFSLWLKDCQSFRTPMVICLRRRYTPYSVAQGIIALLRGMTENPYARSRCGTQFEASPKAKYRKRITCVARDGSPRANLVSANAIVNSINF